MALLLVGCSCSLLAPRMSVRLAVAVPGLSKHAALHACTARSHLAPTMSDEPSAGSQPSTSKLTLAERGIAAALAYSSISAIWYLAGMTLYLLSTAPAPASAMLRPIRAVAQRMGTAWVITFAASQVSTPWRGAGALALTPFYARLLRGNSSSARVRIYRAVLCVMVVVGVFGTGLTLLSVRELARL